MFVANFRCFWEHAVFSQLINASDDADALRGQYHVMMTKIDRLCFHVHRINVVEIPIIQHFVALRELATISIFHER